MTPIETDRGVPCSFESPESSNIAGASYDPDTLTLTVTFKGHRGAEGRVYQTGSFTLAQWQDFLAAPSKGTFFAQQIRPLFSMVRL